MLEKSLIGPVEVKRDEEGYWYHPGVPDFDESVAAYKEWVSAQRIEITGWHMDSDLESHPYFDGEAANCLSWEPHPPARTGSYWAYSIRTTAHTFSGLAVRTSLQNLDGHHRCSDG